MARTANGGGGAIYNSGTLTTTNSAISSNTAQSLAGAIDNPDGTLTIDNSTVNGNSTPYDGGGIVNGAQLTITNSTISGNSAIGEREGGGIWNSGTLTINNSTLSQNSAGYAGGAILIDYGGIANVQNTIVANSPSGGNCYINRGSIISNGYNLSSDGTCPFNGPGDLQNTDPKLGPLKNNGGPTRTQALLAGSPAIDTGNPNGCTDSYGKLLKTDQRGKPRPDPEDTGGCDMGAYEVQTGP